jgi:uncharacterized protein
MKADRAASILWRRLDRPGHEFARVAPAGAGWSLSGTAVLLHEGVSCRLDYDVRCNERWETTSGKVTGWVGRDEVSIDVAVGPGGSWRSNGVEVPTVSGAIDLDLNFSPSTNLLPIRRLNLAVGQEAAVRSAWLRFPSFVFEPLEQTYRRLDVSTYRYASAGGRFTADLTVSGVGLVTLYPGLAETEG